MEKVYWQKNSEDREMYPSVISFVTDGHFSKKFNV